MPAAKTVLVFGTFDRLHDGHRFFLSQARALGTRLIAAVATDEVVMQIKKRKPAEPQQERMKALRKSGLVDKVISGDTELGNWSPILREKPDLVALGYDQTALEARLREFIQKNSLRVKLITLRALEPDRLHSRMLRKK